MGVWEWINSALTSVKEKTPDMTPAIEIGRKSYGYCRDSTVRFAGATTTAAREVHDYLSRDHNRDNLGRLAKNVTKNGALYLARCYGGGPIIDIVSRSVQENKADLHKGRIEELETKVAKLEKLSSRNIPQQSEIQRLTTVSKSQDDSNFRGTTNQRPEDVLKVFMTEQFVGKKLFDNLIIPAGFRSKKEKSV